MTLTTHVTSEEREAICRQAIIHLGEVGDLWSAIENEDFETAERLGREFADELRLLDDLSWGDAPAGTATELTMPAEELHRVFTHLRSDAESLRRDGERDEADAGNEAGECRRRAKLVTEACERVLGIVGRTPPPGLSMG